MAWPVTLNGRVYNADDFEGTAYVTGMPDAFEDFANHAASIHTGLVYQSINLTNSSSQRGATLALTILGATYTIGGSVVSVNKSFAPGQPIRLAHYTGTTLDGFLDGTVTTFNATTGALEFLVGNRIKNSAAASYGSGSDAWNVSIGGTGDHLPLAPGTDYYSVAQANDMFLNEASNLSDISSASTAVSNLGFTATVAEINAVCDGSTVKNSHTHTADTDSRYTRTYTGGSTPSASKAGDIWTNGSTIKISTGSGTANWKQVFPAIYS
jgi:hypothetical protein